jgi:magnesium-transporting ATPase (P-type)
MLLTDFIPPLTRMVKADRPTEPITQALTRFAVLIIGVLAVGAFAFVVLLTWLRTLHHKISSRTPFSAWLFCLVCDLAVTVWLWPRYDPLTEDHYLPFIYAGWIAIILLGLLALFICARWVVREPH